ncbi:N-methyl-L-tryptophan oxidase [Umezawaea sp.]|uniref:N-methyl-L-tryptophan oxidase n=1 Tax=Umezawaea sp. TaxID=1955258 RepID=UPI002ED22894
MNCDVLVVGAGVVGAATTWALAERGARVLTLDAHGPTHRYGSSHGESRIFRRAYWEGAAYLPLLNRANELWAELEEAHGDTLLVRTGGVFIGSGEGGVVPLGRRTARLGGIEHEVWNAARLADRFPWFGVDEGMTALYEPGAYTVLAARARLAMLDAAVRRRARLRFGDEAERLRPVVDGVEVRLRSGEKISCGVVVLATGPWMQGALAIGLGHVLAPVRVPVYWFRADHRLGIEGFPAFLYESAGGGVVYGVPEWGGGAPRIKVGFHNRQQRPGDPQNTTSHAVAPRFRREMAAVVSRILTGVDPEPVSWRQCYYTLTPDGGFVIDRSPADPRVVHVSACSGHGFKFATAVGECAAALALGEPASVDLSPFTSARFEEERQISRSAPRT